ncbi:MAG TPA: hypothetical protein DIT28_03390 [Oxalobacteraceae bacterium]|jgi:hypothetical protein|nr:hypothetical protein [Oxalobacteraceae bacterium]HCN88206.1 hypothetical protein [Oxalobacteraceae bacterium]
MQRILSFDQTPPFSVPLRFFLTAPLFSMLAAALLFWQGPEAFTSRWSPFMLALTHLMTLGFLASAMIGALIQILPVVAGISLPRPRLTAGVVHTFLSAGTALLAAAFWLSRAVLFRLALVCLVLAFGWLLVAAAIGLRQAPAPGATATVAAIRLALAALLITVLLGTTLGSAFAWPLALPLILLANLHVAWGLLGWLALLVIGVAFQVVPMFLVTPLYPRHVTRWLAALLFLLLVLWSLTEVILQGHPRWPAMLVSALIVASLTLFGATTLYLLWRRKRPKADATTLFWRTSMASLLACAVLWTVSSALVPASHSLTLGILLIVGFGYSAINGMLYKIVPFLAWYHAQNEVAIGCRTVPSVKKILPDSVAVKQFWCHLAALLLLVAATLWPVMLTRVAAFALCVSSGWLAFNVIHAVRIYWRISRDAALAVVVP